MASPTSRTTQWAKKNGYSAAIVEKWNKFAGIRQDMFGFIDVVLIDGIRPVWGLQITSTGNMASRIKKSLESPNLALWCGSGARFSVVGWSKKGGKGKRKLWEMKMVHLTPGAIHTESTDSKIELPSVDSPHD